MRPPSLFRSLTLLVPLWVQLSSPSAVYAQQEFVLEEVLVTAQKRQESAQDVPMTVNALLGEVLNDLKMFTFEELQQVTPGLDMRLIDGRAGSIALRGVDYNPNSAASQAVDLYWNDRISMRLLQGY